MIHARAEAVRNIKSAADRINRQAVDKQRIGGRWAIDIKDKTQINC